MTAESWCQKYSPFILRMGLAVVSLWYSILCLLDPTSTAVFFKAWSIDAVGTASLIIGIIALILAIMLFLGFFTKVALVAIMLVNLISLVSMFWIGVFKAAGFPYLNMLGAFLLKDLIVLSGTFLLYSQDHIPYSLDNLFK